MTDEQIYLEFARRKQRRTIALWTALGSAAAMLMLSELVAFPAAVAAVAALVMVALVAILWRVWRCPVCDRALGREFDYQFCPKCGARLSP